MTLWLLVTLGSTHSQLCVVHMFISHSVPTELCVVRHWCSEFHWWSVLGPGSADFVALPVPDILAVGFPNADPLAADEFYQLPV